MSYKHLLDVYMTSATYFRRLIHYRVISPCIDVETTSCIYWVISFGNKGKPNYFCFQCQMSRGHWEEMPQSVWSFCKNLSIKTVLRARKLFIVRALYYLEFCEIFQTSCFCLTSYSLIQLPGAKVLQIIWCKKFAGKHMGAWNAIKK